MIVDSVFWEELPKCFIFIYDDTCNSCGGFSIKRREDAEIKNQTPIRHSQVTL